MSSGVNPISAAQLMDECSPANKQYTKVLWHKNKTLLVRRFIPLEEVPGIFDMIMGTIVRPEKSLLFPELKDFAIRAAIVSGYALVDFPDTVEKQYELLYTTDLFDTVLKTANKAQAQSIIDAVDFCLRSKG